jgi:tRNA modification GTPase
VLSSLIARGVRQALPGEFTRRALLNGKMDLLQAEAVADLIDSRSRGAAAAALRHLDGGLTRRITELRLAILDLEALVAYDIDFPEEDDGPVDRARVWDACERVENQLESLMRTAAVGEILREGALVVIAGAPNTGKSSLFNALVGRRRALVADQPGTTRDAIEAVIDADSWTIRLVDTAGLRSTAELIERMGIEVSEEYLSQAQVVLVCGDTDELLAHAVTSVSELSSARLIGVSTKSDLHRSAPEVTPGGRLASVHAVSAQTGEGLKQLVSGICDVLASQHSGVDATAPLLLRTRHLRAVQEASEEMRHFADAVREENIPMSIAGTHLHSAALALESLIGVIQVDDVLDRVFSSFCVGK